jgi:hypothetical protein
MSRIHDDRESFEARHTERAGADVSDGGGRVGHVSDTSDTPDTPDTSDGRVGLLRERMDFYSNM